MKNKVLIDVTNGRLHNALVYDGERETAITFTHSCCPHSHEALIRLVGTELERVAAGLPFAAYWNVIWMIELVCFAEERAFAEQICGKDNIQCVTVESMLLQYCLFQKAEETQDVYAFSIADRRLTVNRKTEQVFTCSCQEGSILAEASTIVPLDLAALKRWYIREAKWSEKHRANYLVSVNGLPGIKTFVDKCTGYTVLFDQIGSYADVLLSITEGRRYVVFYDQLFFEHVGMLPECIITHENCAGAFPILTSKDGSETKELNLVLQMCNNLCTASASRETPVVAIGGGVLLDLAGMAAALYKRGVKQFIKVPTTLIAQVDAGIGIKVGCNYGGKQNLLGSFFPASYIIDSFPFLKYQSVYKIRCGMAELVKTALIGDAILLDKLGQYATSHQGYEKETFSENSRLFAVIQYGIIATLNLLKIDPYERDSARRLCDFGHSFSGLLHDTDGRRLHHGVAVAMEMLFATELSWKLSLLNDAVYQEYVGLLSALQIIDDGSLQALCCFAPTDFDKFIDATAEKRGGDLNFLLPVGRGRVGFMNLLECQSKEDYVLLLKRNEFKSLFFEVLHTICQRFRRNNTIRR